jgi:hypothetical protein
VSEYSNRLGGFFDLLARIFARGVGVTSKFGCQKLDIFVRFLNGLTRMLAESVLELLLSID